MTRKLMLIVLASTMLTGTPIIPEPAEARSLFDSLFPRAAERRRDRYERRRLRYLRQRAVEERHWRRQLLRKRRKRAAATRKPKVSTSSFKLYTAAVLAPVKFATLQAAFEKREHEILTAKALQNVGELPLIEPSVEQPQGVPSVTSDPVYGPPAAPLQPAAAEQPNLTEREEAALELPLLVSSTITGALASSSEIRLSAGTEYLPQIDLRAKRNLGKAVIAHYKNSPEFLWIDAAGELNEKGLAVVAVLADAEAYGLKSSDYAISVTFGDPLHSAMEKEFALTVAALRYMADARNGVANPNRISGYHDFKALGTDFTKVLTSLAASEVPQEALLKAHPRGKTFDTLRRELADLRNSTKNIDLVTITPGTFVRPGQTNDQIANIVEGMRRKASPELLEKHATVFSASHIDGVYGPEIVVLVKDFQRENRLGADGIIGKRTIAKMVGDNPNARLNKVLLAMERLRWHPDSLPATRVFINQAAYRATYYRNGKSQVSMKTVVGKPSNQTNFFYDEIEYVEYNPYWGVPRSILVNEMLPKLRSNPGYLDNRGFEIRNKRGKRVSSYNVDWWEVGENFPFDVRQPPGRKNALGELKIMFPNKHSIYMHDTPAKKLFGRDKRAFSHGCVRLENPRLMAAAVLGTTVDHIGAQIADGQNKKQQLKRKTPVFVSYFTAWPSDDGEVKYFSDVYGRDGALSKALAKERKARERARGA